MKKVNKKWLGIMAVMFLLVSSVAVGVYSYLSDREDAKNNMTVGAVNTEIVEEFDPPEDPEPGDSFTKDVKVKNLGPTDCYVRIKAVFSDSDMEKLCEVDWNTTDFVYNATDGYYYYTEELKVGDLTPSLFTAVTIKSSYDKDGDGTADTLTADDLKDFDIIVYQESYQSTYNDPNNMETRKFSDYTEAWNHYQTNKPN